MIQFFNNPKFQEFDSSGNPLSGGKVYFTLAGTNTPEDTYPTLADALAHTNANTNPVTLDSRGEASIVLKPGSVYKVVLKDSSLNTIWTLDNTNSITNIIYDGNGNELLDFTTAASAVNYIKIGNAATGVNPFIQGTGDDGTVGLDFKDKASNFLLSLNAVVDSVNYTSLTPAITAGTVQYGVLGTDTNIAVQLLGKGTGPVKIGQATSTGVWLVADQPICDSSGNELVQFVKAANAVNNIQVTNSASTPVRIDAVGDSTGIDIVLAAKGSGAAIISGRAAATCVFRDVAATTHEVLHSLSSVTASRTVTWPDSDITIPSSFLSAASASDQETGSSTTVAVTPAVQQRHPSSAKAWVYITYSTGTPTATASYNVSSLTDTGTGEATVNLTTAFSSTNYALLANKSGVGALLVDTGVTITSTSAYKVSTYNDSASLADINSFSAAFGDQ